MAIAGIFFFEAPIFSASTFGNRARAGWIVSPSFSSDELIGASEKKMPCWERPNCGLPRSEIAPRPLPAGIGHHVHAVSPLVTDDADTVEPGKLQLNCDFQFLRMSSTSLYLVTHQSGLGLDSSFGVRRNIRLSVARWFRVDPDRQRCRRCNGPDDRAQAPPVAGPRGQAEVQARMDRKMPIASERHGLGTANWDNGVVGIGTYTIGKTSLDFNAGFYAIDISRADFDDDRWFVGQTIRQMLNEK